MKHMTKAIAAALAGITALLCTACSSGGSTPSVPDNAAYYETDTDFGDSQYETIVAVDTAAVSEMTVNSEANAAEVAHETVSDRSQDYSFRSAVWLAKDTADDSERYFRFFDDANGIMLEQETGTGVGFTCELTPEKGTFHFGAPDTSTTVEFIWLDENTVALNWSDGKQEVLTFLRENGAEELTFFSNEQLSAMALAYCEGHTGYRPSMVSTIINMDETISIQLYDLVDDHTSTTDWYTVDRYTGTGFDILSQPVDLTKPLPDGAVPAETVPGETAAETVPGETVPAETVVGETIPAESVSTETTPVA